MEFLNILWIFLVIAALVPLIQKRMVESTRVGMLRRLEQTRGSRAIALIHRQESLNFLGFPMSRYLDIQDSEDVLRAIKLTDPRMPLDLILHTPGGLVLAAEQIANALCKRAGKVTVFIPHYAMSGGTMLALAADEIIMDENAVMGPVDPQIGEYPAASILAAVEQKNPNEVDDQTLILADISRKALAQVKEMICRIAQKHYSEAKACELGEALASGRWTHDYPISVEEGRQLGLNITTEMPSEIYKLMSLYPQSTQRRPTVSYIPLPYPASPALPGRIDRKQ